MEAFLTEIMRRLLPAGVTFELHPFQGKRDLLDNLEPRLKGYASWLPVGHRIFVVVDRDNEDCRVLKQRLEAIAARVGLSTRTTAADSNWTLANRIAIEELEAWYFGDWQAVRAAYPRVSQLVPNRAPFRRPDSIAGGTWEAFERVMQQFGYFKGGLPKIEAARNIAMHFVPNRNQSRSFNCLMEAVEEALE